MRSHTRMFAALLGSLWFLCLAFPAHAIPIFDFDIYFETGTLSGNTYTGTITTDSSAQAFYNPSGSAGGTLLSFDIIVDGIAFDEISDLFYDSNPLVAIGGYQNIANIEYRGFAGSNSLSIVYVREERDNLVAFQTSSGDTSRGNYVGYRCVEGCTVEVPEPSTLALLGLGIAGMALTRRSRMKRACLSV